MCQGAEGPGANITPMSGRSAPQPLWAKLVSVAALLAIVWILGQLIGPVLVIFAVSTIVALLLNPLVRMLRRLHIPRGLAVLAVFTGFIAAIALAVFLIISPVRTQVEEIQANLPAYTDQAERQADKLQRFFDERGDRRGRQGPLGRVPRGAPGPRLRGRRQRRRLQPRRAGRGDPADPDPGLLHLHAARRPAHPALRQAHRRARGGGVPAPHRAHPDRVREGPAPDLAGDRHERRHRPVAVRRHRHLPPRARRSPWRSPRGCS